MALTIRRSDTGAIVTSDSTVTIEIDSTLSLTATSSSGETIRWFSSTVNNSVCIIGDGSSEIYSNTITITPVAIGTTQYGIFCWEGNSSNANIIVQVVAAGGGGGTTTIPVTGVSVIPSALSLIIGQTSQLTATVTPINATNNAVSWTSTNSSIASVNSAGLVTAKAVGSATIRANTNDGSYYDTCTVTVSATSSEGGSHLYLDCISYGENNFDYGIVSIIGGALGTTNADDSSTAPENVKHSFKGEASPSVKSIDYGVLDVGTYVIYAKYRKDSSVDEDNDSLKFKVRLVNETGYTSSYTVASVSGANYGFSLTSDGYYTSGNAGVQSSAALCKITITITDSSSGDSGGDYAIYFDCINYAETNFDYGILSNIGCTLLMSNTNDSDSYPSNVKHNFKGSSKSSVQTVSYGSYGAGTYVIYVKFRKDGSDSSYNDSLKFKVRIVNNGTSSAQASYTVEDVSGATYGFALTSDGYYTSENESVDGSYAICKVTIIIPDSGALENVYITLFNNYNSDECSNPQTLELDEIFSLYAKVTPSDVSDTSVTFEWLENDGCILVVTNTESVIFYRGKGVGTARLKIISNYNPDVFVVLEIIVTATEDHIPVTSIVLDRTVIETRVAAGASYIYCTVYPDDATTKDLTWTSSNSDVATIQASGENGYLRIIGKGETTITATAVDGSGVYATCVVIVRPQPYIKTITNGWQKVTPFLRVSNTWIELTADIYPYVFGSGIMREPKFLIESIGDASYGFELTDDGYYTSMNAGVDYSAALCQVTIDTPGGYNIYVDCINYAENNYDYGLLSNIGQSLGTTYGDDGATGTTLVKHNFKGLNSSSVQTVDYGVLSAGVYTIHVKFRKDQSSSTLNDSLKFKMRYS